MRLERSEQQRLWGLVKGLWQPLGNTLQWFVKKIERWDQLTSQRRQLREMDDRLLKDIGLSRADVERIAGRRRFWDDPAESGEQVDERYRTADYGEDGNQSAVGRQSIHTESGSLPVSSTANQCD